MMKILHLCGKYLSFVSIATLSFPFTMGGYQKMSSQLPNLPVYKFHDPTITNFHISSKCTSKNGFNFVRNDGLSFANRSLDTHSVGYIDKDTSIRYNPRLTYGVAKSSFTRKFIPNHAVYANKCLTFHGYYKQSIPSEDEHFLNHCVNIHYFLEDDTITVIEPKILNSGFLGGRIIRRRRIEKPNTNDFWHWKDLNTDIDIDLQGIIFHTVSCDYFTKEFMRSQGIDVGPVEQNHRPRDIIGEENYHLYRRSPPSVKFTPRGFENEILNFRCTWDNREFKLSFYLEDDTISVKKFLNTNDGRDPCPYLIRRMRIAKNQFYENLVCEDNPVFYEVPDLIVGSNLVILGRSFLLTSCDYKTKSFYKKVLNIDQPDSVVLEKRSEEGPFRDEMLKSRKRIADQTIRYPKDELKLILNGNKFLRFSAEIISPHPEDGGRKFLLYYFLADDTIKINEIKKDNSGIMGGKFLARQKLPKGGSFLTLDDLQIGTVLEVYKHFFRITGTDLEVFYYVNERKDEYSLSLYHNLKEYFELKGLLPKSVDRNVPSLKTDELGKFSNEKYDPDAECRECRYPMVADGLLISPRCTHAKKYSDSLLNKPKTDQDEFELATTENISTLNHLKDGIYKQDCLIDNSPVDERIKRVTFAD